MSSKTAELQELGKMLTATEVNDLKRIKYIQDKISELIATEKHHDDPMECEVKNGKLVMSIGVDRLAWCTENDAGPNEGTKVLDPKQLCEDVAIEMWRDDESGYTTLGKFLDEMVKKAILDGSVAVDHETVPEYN